MRRCASLRRRDAQGRAPLAPPRPRRRPRRATRAMFPSARCCTRWCRRTTRISSRVLRLKNARFPSTCTRNSRNTCAVVCSTTASCGWCASSAMPSGWWHFPARSAASAPSAAHGAWLSPNQWVSRTRGLNNSGIELFRPSLRNSHSSLTLSYSAQSGLRSALRVGSTFVHAGPIAMKAKERSVFDPPLSPVRAVAEPAFRKGNTTPSRVSSFWLP